jgi:hypothetical protein
LFTLGKKLILDKKNVGLLVFTVLNKTIKWFGLHLINFLTKASGHPGWKRAIYRYTSFQLHS